MKAERHEVAFYKAVHINIIEGSEPMLLIGENLNVINRVIGKAFKEKDPGPIVEEAKRQNITTISITGFDGGYLKEISDYNFNVDLDDTEEVEGIHSLVAHLIVATVRDLKEAFGLKEETSTVEAYLESLK